MPTTYTLVPIPRWYFADNAGLPLGAGYMATFRSIDKITPKSIYTDPAGQFPWANPVLFNANGEAPGMFFWANDEPYFGEVFDSNGILMFTFDGYGPGIAGGGGSGPITASNSFLENYITNNVFWRNAGTLSAITNNTVLAPSNHEGFAQPDIRYLASGGSGSTDSITFTQFVAGSVPLTGDITPEFYIDWQCTVAGTETSKAVQFPVDLHVKNLEQTTMTAIIWANGISGTQNLTMSFIQDFGTGAGSTAVATVIAIGATPLTNNTWQSYLATFISPTVNGKSLGAGGDDATYIQVGLPAGQLGRILFTKPKLYLGTIGSVFPELPSYDYVDRIISSPRTGDIRTSLNSFAPFGWIPMNDGSIGSAASAATNRANIDTWQLYNLIWSNVLDHWAPVAGGRGASAIADFSANKILTLTRSLGRVMSGANANTITAQTFTTNYAGNHFQLTVNSITEFPVGTPVQLTNSGGALPSALAANTVYYVTNPTGSTIDLAVTLDLAYAGSATDIGSDGTGTNTVQTALGAYLGESLHTLTIAEMPAHTHHTFSGSAGAFSENAPSGSRVSPNDAGTSSSTGGGGGHNTIPPEVMMNVFIKL